MPSLHFLRMLFFVGSPACLSLLFLLHHFHAVESIFNFMGVTGVPFSTVICKIYSSLRVGLWKMASATSEEYWSRQSIRLVIRRLMFARTDHTCIFMSRRHHFSRIKASRKVIRNALFSLLLCMASNFWFHSPLTYLFDHELDLEIKSDLFPYGKIFTSHLSIGDIDFSTTPVSGERNKSLASERGGLFWESFFYLYGFSQPYVNLLRVELRNGIQFNPSEQYKSPRPLPDWYGRIDGRKALGCSGPDPLPCLDN